MPDTPLIVCPEPIRPHYENIKTYDGFDDWDIILKNAAKMKGYTLTLEVAVQCYKENLKKYKDGENED